MKKVRWAVLGSCGIARRRTIPEGIVQADNAELVGVFDINTAANESLARDLGVWAAGSEAELLACDADAIYIATPANVHCKQVLAAARQGKAVLCEKPLGMTDKQAEEMVRACHDAGVLLGTAFMMRMQSQHRMALDIIQSGKLGKIVYARAQLSCWYPPIESAWRQDPALGGGGSLMDLGGHCIDLLEMFCGRVVQVRCITGNLVHNYKVEDSAVALLSFESGATATVDAFFCIPDAASKNTLEIYGSKGSIIAKGTIGQAQAGKMELYLQDSTGYDAQQLRTADEGVEITPVPVNMYRAEIEEFSAAIIENRETILSAEAGLRSQQILSACYKSAKTGNTVEMNME